MDKTVLHNRSFSSKPDKKAQILTKVDLAKSIYQYKKMFLVIKNNTLKISQNSQYFFVFLKYCSVQ